MDELFDILFRNEVALSVETCTNGDPVWVVKSIKGDEHYCAIAMEAGQPLESFINSFVWPSVHAVRESREAFLRGDDNGVKDLP